MASVNSLSDFENRTSGVAPAFTTEVGNKAWEADKEAMSEVGSTTRTANSLEETDNKYTQISALCVNVFLSRSV